MEWYGLNTLQASGNTLKLIKLMGVSPDTTLLQLTASLMKVSVFMAISVDGYIARKNGDIDWLPKNNASQPDEDFGYLDFFSTVDALIMGRHTFEKVLAFDTWPYDEKDVYVLSSGNVEIPTGIQSTVRTLSETPNAIVEKMEEMGYDHIYVDGGETVRGFLREVLVDDLILTTIPILLGEGIPLFKGEGKELNLELIKSVKYSNGLVKNHYKVSGK